jgi:glycosyltransferase involved in cell wall biosynthesis
MHIASITSSYPRYSGDGVGSFIHSLSSTLSAQGHQVHILTPYNPQSSKEWLAQWKVEPVFFMRPKKWSLLGHSRSLSGDLSLRWHSYPLVALFTFFAFFRLLRLVKEIQAQVIYAHWLIPGGFIGALVARVAKTPLVVSLHGSDVFVAERYPFLKPLIRFIFREVCRVTACSNDLAIRVTKLGLPPKKVTVIPYGVSAECFKPDPLTGQKAREKLAIPLTAKVVVALGRLVRKKGFDFFIHSIPLILASQPNTLFFIGGDGDLSSELQGLADSLNLRDHLFFPGHIPWQETQSYLNMADVVVVPSVIDASGNVDGLPNVLLEAMAAGCAIVASQVAGIPDIIQNNRNGLLVPPGEACALASAVISILENPILGKGLKEAARKTVEADLEWSHIGQRLSTILENCTTAKI